MPSCRPRSPGVFAAGIVRRGSPGRRPLRPATGAAAAKAARPLPARRRGATQSTVGGRGRRATEDAWLRSSTVHDPRGYPPQVAGKPLAPRLESLEGKTLYLVDCLFDNSDVFMDQLQQWFVERLPAVNISAIRPQESWVDDREMRASIAADGDAAILGVGL